MRDMTLHAAMLTLPSLYSYPDIPWQCLVCTVLQGLLIWILHLATCQLCFDVLYGHILDSCLCCFSNLILLFLLWSVVSTLCLQQRHTDNHFVQYFHGKFCDSFHICTCKEWLFLTPVCDFLWGLEPKISLSHILALRHTESHHKACFTCHQECH